MIPGRAAAALPASLARILPRLWSCFLIHSLAPPFPGPGGCGGAAAPPPGIARTIVEIIIPMAVRIDAIVIPCSRKRVFIRSARVFSSCRSRCRLSRIRLNWDRIASLLDEAASRREALSSCSLRRRSAISSLVASSVSSSSFLFSKAMSLSSSEILARFFVSSPPGTFQGLANTYYITGGISLAGEDSDDFLSACNRAVGHSRCDFLTSSWSVFHFFSYSFLVLKAEFSRVRVVIFEPKGIAYGLRPAITVL